MQNRQIPEWEVRKTVRVAGEEKFVIFNPFPPSAEGTRAAEQIPLVRQADPEWPGAAENVVTHLVRSVMRVDDNVSDAALHQLVQPDAEQRFAADRN